MHHITQKLLALIKERGDFPAIASSVHKVIQMTENPDDTDFNLAHAVLEDFALTQKVLKMVNSSMYAAFGGNVTTITQATLILGHDTVGHLALGLKIADNLSAASPKDERARKALAGAVTAGAVARSIGDAAAASPRDAEEANVCALLANLGQLLVQFYLGEEWDRIEEIAPENNRAARNNASLTVLGITFDRLSQEMAEAWNLPGRLVRLIGSEVPLEGGAHATWLHAVVNVSQEAATLIAAGKGAAAHDLLAQHAEALGTTAAALKARVGAVLAESEAARMVTPAEAPTEPQSRLSALRATTRSLTATATSGTALSVVTGAVLETIHCTLKTRRVTLLVRNVAQAAYVSKTGLGPEVAKLTKRFALEEAYAPDIFHVALARNMPVYIRDGKAARLAHQLPAQFLQVVSDDPAFLVLPLSTGTRTIGFIYADWEPGTNEASLDSDEIRALSELRDLLAKAIMAAATAAPVAPAAPAAPANGQIAA